MAEYEITTGIGRKLKCKCNSISEAAKWWVEHDEFDDQTIFHIKAPHHGWGSRGEKVDAIKKVPELFPEQAREAEAQKSGHWWYGEGGVKEGHYKIAGTPKSGEQRFTYKLVYYENDNFLEWAYGDEVRGVNGLIEEWARKGWRVHTMITHHKMGFFDWDKQRFSILFEFDEQRPVPPVEKK